MDGQSTAIQASTLHFEILFVFYVLVYLQSAVRLSTWRAIYILKDTLAEHQTLMSLAAISHIINSFGIFIHNAILSFRDLLLGNLIFHVLSLKMQLS